MKGLDFLQLVLEWALVVSSFILGINLVFDANASEGIYGFIISSFAILVFLASIKLYHLFKTYNGGKD
jgi:hypothetical protein